MASLAFDWHALRARARTRPSPRTVNVGAVASDPVASDLGDVVAAAPGRKLWVLTSGLGGGRLRGLHDGLPVPRRAPPAPRTLAASQPRCEGRGRSEGGTENRGLDSPVVLGNDAASRAERAVRLARPGKLTSSAMD